jgi:hypothetical protein
LMSLARSFFPFLNSCSFIDAFFCVITVNVLHNFCLYFYWFLPSGFLEYDLLLFPEIICLQYLGFAWLFVFLFFCLEQYYTRQLNEAHFAPFRCLSHLGSSFLPMPLPCLIFLVTLITIKHIIYFIY